MRVCVAILAVLGGLATVPGCGSGSGGAVDAGVQLPMVQTTEGEVICALDSSAAVWSCKGIPYAAPPVGDLRWHAPMPPPVHAQPLDGTKFGPGCMQSGSGGSFFASTGPTSEDCLSLNVWFPASAVKHPAPVMVWIHGGGFINGTGSMSLYDGTNLAEKDAVIVTINYRLGPLGWVPHKDLIGRDPMHPGSGNYGLLDQIQALRWVHENIAAFGGDASNVTVFGESAGGVSVCSILVSPLAAGLFQHAIIESGPCLTAAEMLTLTGATPQGDRLATALDCDTAADVVACMRAASAATVSNALPSGIFPVGNQESWLPIVDGDAEPTTVADAIRAGKSTDIPLLLGVNGEEGSLLVAASGLNDLNGVTTFLTQKIGATGTNTILANYPPSRYGGSSADAAYAIIGDGLMLCPSQRAAEDFAAQGGNVHAYFFTYVTSYGDLLGWGAFHGSDLPFVFRNTTLISGVSIGPLTGEEGTVSDFFQGYWVNMAAAGSPGTVSGVAWPSYAGPGGMLMDLQPQSSPIQGWPHASDCAVWKQVLGTLL